MNIPSDHLDGENVQQRRPVFENVQHRLSGDDAIGLPLAYVVQVLAGLPCDLCHHGHSSELQPLSCRL